VKLTFLKQTGEGLSVSLTLSPFYLEGWASEGNGCMVLQKPTTDLLPYHLFGEFDDLNELEKVKVFTFTFSSSFKCQLNIHLI